MMVHPASRLLLVHVLYLLLPRETLSETQSVFVHLPANQTGFQYHLSRDVLFQGARFRRVWVYANGIVAIGDPLPDRAYPVSKATGRIYETLRDLHGTNAIAVFVLANERRPASIVRAREIGGAPRDEGERHLLKLWQERVTAQYGLDPSDSVSHALEVEWLNMHPCETRGDEKNSFQLHLLSTLGRTFCVVQYTSIQASHCAITDKRVPYQSGITSTSRGAYWPAPAFETGRKIIDSQYPQVDVADSWITPLDTIKMARLLSWDLGERRKKGKTQREDNVFDSRPVEAGRFRIYPKTEKSSGRAKRETEAINNESTLPKLSHPSESLVNESAESSRSRDLLTSLIEFSKSNQKTLQMPFESPPISLTRAADVKMTTGRRHQGLIGTQQEIINRRPENIVFLGYGTDIRPPKISNRLARLASCSNHTCLKNEQCFRLSNGKVCCRCRPGFVFRLGTCLERDTHFSIFSNNSVHISTERTNWTLDFSLTIATSTYLDERFQRAHFTLISSRPLLSELQNFLFLLYPLFHIPLSFYASPWKSESVPNLNSLIANRARIDIQLSIANGSHQMSLSFWVERKVGIDKWTTFVKGVNLKNLKDLSVENARFDEKASSETYNLIYVLRNGNVVEFPEQRALFQDEETRRVLQVKWRGKMEFVATCLAKHIRNQTYFIKFSDRRYCNSDCLGSGHQRTSCRLMCLGSPFVFNSTPDPCQGNFCGAKRTCLNRGNVYECVCSEGYVEKDNKCVAERYSTSASSTAVSAPDKGISGCPSCSENARCQIVMDRKCCLCQRGYLGSGRLCFEKNSPFELGGSGRLTITQDEAGPTVDIRIRLLFRQWTSSTGQIQHGSYFELDQLPYVHDQDRRLVHLLLLISPLFELPLATLPRETTSAHLHSLYALAKGAVNLSITIESNLLPDMTMSIMMQEEAGHLQISMALAGIPTALASIVLPDTTSFFNKRPMSNITYMIKQDHIIFSRQRIATPPEAGNLMLWWRGTGHAHPCSAGQTRESTFSVAATAPRYRCGARCNGTHCMPYCQAQPELQELLSAIHCPQTCHQFAKCVNGVCVCLPAFSGNGLQCLRIRKFLECLSSADCASKPHTECKGRRCLCMPGYQMRNGRCVDSEKCHACGANEVCMAGECLCKSRLVRNRISGRCVFDCSLCDPHSTECREDGCSCRSGFKASSESGTFCSLPCSTDADCPTHETCLGSRMCWCPLTRENGVCQPSDACGHCHDNAVCKGTRCVCGSDWHGDGIHCVFNCSVCFDKSYCSPQRGCSCPPALTGDGKRCSPRTCSPSCPINARCDRRNNESVCLCDQGFVLHSNKCISDVVKLTIIPSDPTVVAAEGESLDLICVASSERAGVSVQWFRRSGRPIRENQQLIQDSNTAMKLRLISVTDEDADIYTCSSGLGHQISTNITIATGLPPCRARCGQFSLCARGQCVCIEGYMLDGIQCVPRNPCSRVCDSNEECNRTTGKCSCHSGFVRDNSSCVEDCRRHSVCHKQARCSAATGLCECQSPFVGNGTMCRDPDDCGLTRRCVVNATCQFLKEVRQSLCLCDAGFVGDGSVVCHPRVDCAVHNCGSHSRCQQVLVKDSWGNEVGNGRCSCAQGYELLKDSCRKREREPLTFWLAMGEAIIRHQGGNMRARILYIDDRRTNGKVNAITAMVGSDCETGRLVWSGHNGVTIKSSLAGSFSNTLLHMSGLGRVAGLVSDHETGNVFYSDAYYGHIGVLQTERNISRVLIALRDYSPGPIAIHHASQRLVWIVNDYLNPRIECSLMTGQERVILVTLNNPGLSIVVVEAWSPTNKLLLEDRVCWMERLQPSGLPISRIKAVLKCVPIRAGFAPSAVEIVHQIRDHEPYTSLVHDDGTFYWNVRRRDFIKSWDGEKESQMNIRPKCCEAAIGTFIRSSRRCLSPNMMNPCWKRAEPRKCAAFCIPMISAMGKLEPVCLHADSPSSKSHLDEGVL